MYNLEMTKLSIVILHYNGKEMLSQCLQALLSVINKEKKSLKNLEVEIIVVDNGSSDGSVSAIRKLKVTPPRLSRDEVGKGETLKIVENKENLGFAEGNNVGIKKAIKEGADYIMVLNNDVIVKDAFWLPLIDFIKKHKKVGAVGPKIYFAPGREFHKARYQEKERGKVIWFAGGELDWKNVYAFHRGVDQVDTGQYDKPIETDFASGCCLLARSSTWEKAKFFDERYFLYYEDSDLCLRLKKLGLKIFYVPEAKIWHINAGSSDCGGELQDYFITRNRLLFGMRWAPFRTKIALLRESIRTLLTGRKWQIIGIKDFYLNRFKKGSWL